MFEKSLVYICHFVKEFEQKIYETIAVYIFNASDWLAFEIFPLKFRNFTYIRLLSFTKSESEMI